MDSKDQGYCPGSAYYHQPGTGQGWSLIVASPKLIAKSYHLSHTYYKLTLFMFLFYYSHFLDKKQRGFSNLLKVMQCSQQVVEAGFKLMYGTALQLCSYL